ncbi:MAG: flagellar basal body rod protein FlgB [Acidobacteria bacterium]|nr:flagellar basal body rod protein FlgB [Acidobacteriota bacterium]
MYLDLFESKTLNAMESYMDRLSQRHKIVASNIANIDTPGYKTRDISFHATIDELLTEPSAGRLRLTRERHIDAEGVGPLNMVFEPKGLIERADRNNVDIDREMTKLSETSFGYSMMTQLLRGKYQKLSTSINEGR